MKTSAGPRGRRLNGRKPKHANMPASAKARKASFGWSGDGVDGEEEERDRGERGREAVHVVEQVEGVRDADQPHDGDRVCKHLVVDDLDVRARREHDRGGSALDCELPERRDAEQVVEEPRGEDERDRGVDPDEGACRARRRPPRRRPRGQR